MDDEQWTANKADTTTHFHGAMINTTPTGTRLILLLSVAPFTLSSAMTVSASASCALAMSQRARPTKPRNSPVCDNKLRVRWDIELWEGWTHPRSALWAGPSGR